MTCRHENVVRIREVVVGDTLTQCVSNFFQRWNPRISITGTRFPVRFKLQPEHTKLPNPVFRVSRYGKGCLW